MYMRKNIADSKGSNASRTVGDGGVGDASPSLVEYFNDRWVAARELTHIDSHGLDWYLAR